MIESIRRALTVRKISFQLCIALLFTALIVPVLFAILSYSYERNSSNLIAMSDSSIDRARDDSISIVTNLLDPVISTLRLTAKSRRPTRIISAPRRAATSSTRR
jgi:hypothetical protein